jgi:hypothetical protein
MARQRGIVVWLDSDNSYSELVAELVLRHEQGQYDVPVLGFHDSYLELLLALEGREDGVGMTPLIVHVPGLTEDSMRTTPLLELYRAGQRHRRALPTLVREAAHGRASADDIEAFVARGDLSLEGADTWLSNYGEGNTKLGPDLSALNAQALFESVRPNGSLAATADDPEVLAAIWQRASQLLGIHEDWRPDLAPNDNSSAADSASYLASEMAVWCMCVEFIDDLKRPPKDVWLLPLTKLAPPFRRTSKELVAHLRERHDQYYASCADELEHAMHNELREATAEDLGRIDTFRFEDQKLLGAALDALEDQRYPEAHEWAVQRTDGRSFWTQHDRGRHLAWHLIELASQLGLAMRSSETLLATCDSVGDASAAYATSGYQVDRHHRQLEQAFQNAGIIKFDEYPAMLRCVERMRHRYRAWLDRLSIEFTVLCEKHGFLPSASDQQRTLFEQVVQPFAAEEGVTAYFMVDALRYEMGEQLVAAMGVSANVEVHIRPRLAELPTLTEVGMNVLAPVCESGNLRPQIAGKIKGFRAGESRVHSPETRRKAMHQRVGGYACVCKSLKDVVTAEVATLRKTIGRSNLVVVHCEGIDKAGEKGVGLVVFERELQNLRAAWSRLHEAGVKRFVITADHGFLLHDPMTRNALNFADNKTVPKRRHLIYDYATADDRTVSVSCTELGYQGADSHFIFPRDGAPFDIGARAKDFVHGGNSLQERVIPVITVEHRYQAGTEVVSYAFETEPVKQSGHKHSVRARVIQLGQTSTLNYAGQRNVEVTVECEGSNTAQLEVVDVRGAEKAGNVITVPVEAWFEVSFRITSERSERVRVQLAHATGAAGFTALSIAERFDVEVMALSTPLPPEDTPADDEAGWLTELPDEGTRKVFAHIAKHGSISEVDATKLLDGARAFRRFSRNLDKHVAVSPFRVRVEVASGVKCYVRGEEE